MTDGPLVDVHAHFVTDTYRDLARQAGHQRPDGMPGWPSWDAATHLELMDRWRVRTAMLSISSPGVHFGDDRAARTLARDVNEAGAAIARAHPGRFGHFASLPLPDVPGALEEACYALDVLRSDGVVVETNAGGRYPADPAFAPLWRELDERAAVVFVHPTSPPGCEAVSLGWPRPMLEFLFDSARAATDLVLSGVLARHPRIRWIFTHGGGVLPLLADRLEMFRASFGQGTRATNVRHQLARLWFDMAGTPFPRQIPAMVDAFGGERLLYGSDYCWTPAALTTAQISALDTAEQPDGQTWRTLTTRNARELFPHLT
ncbi:amidohydrolase family protein [Actinomadura opuntiae]|uniref:amidohydrolase family protein n=1 Tax=Actinomadura sp. OS1-43 TaxID=604315 RepID=UPI00255B25BE|nr:amidohydrolase family protein [Actinomadura sp. OS1-43]MDL4818512.1 amidohydrolase family protein [Actinomadura sp. OS1-43]